MKKLITHTVPLLLLFASPLIQAQVLFSEDFNSYSAGHLNTDYTNTTKGQGGWLVSRSNNATETAMVTAESGKGNVLTITANTTAAGTALNFRQDDGVIDVLWKSRTAGNDIMKFEYEFYGVDIFSSGGGILRDVAGLINMGFQSNLNRIIGSYWDTSFKTIVLQNYNTAPFPYSTWIKAEMFIDYNTNTVYFYIPTLSLQKAATFSHNKIPEGISFTTVSLTSSSVVKLDNIKLSALQTLPAYILSTSEQLAAKFNLYPNPASSVVNITNSENMLVKQVTIYDVAGKLLRTQSFNNETEIQLNVANLTSGTYLLHLKTETGTAVKKLVKK